MRSDEVLVKHRLCRKVGCPSLISKKVSTDFISTRRGRAFATGGVGASLVTGFSLDALVAVGLSLEVGTLLECFGFFIFLEG